MCGIGGIFSLEKVDRNKLHVINKIQAHRGPDGLGVYISPDKKLGFCHQRLAIIDLTSTGKQPMPNEDKTVWITFNGEIYNYQEFVPKLKKRGHKFRGTSDTEAILHAYEEYGEDCLELFRGMFAFAIWDEKKKKLFIARDRVGQKPLYYGKFGSSVYFASELHSILEASNCKREINPEALHMYLLYNMHHVPEPFSIIKGIKKLPPAHFMTIDDSGIRIKKYWKPDYTKEKKSEKEYISEYKQLAKECINLREVSDVPISALLSGGLDSSTIIAFMNNKNVSTFSIGMGENDSELQRARIISNLFNTKNKEIIFQEKFIKKLPELIYKYGEPYNLMPALYSFVLCEKISKNFKVTISGNGADEIFYGYDGSGGLLMLTKIEKFMPRFIAKILSKFAPSKETKIGLIALGSPKHKQKGNIYRYFGKQLKDLYSDDIKEYLSDFDEGEIIDNVMKDCNSPHLIERFYHAGLMLENAHSVTIVADTTGLAHGVELRAPFLDHKMIEFAASLPLKMKVRYDKKFNKYIMKKSMEGILPDEIIYGKKMGFGYNIKWDELLKTDWKNFVDRVLNIELPKTKLF